MAGPALVDAGVIGGSAFEELCGYRWALGRLRHFLRQRSTSWPSDEEGQHQRLR